MAKQKLGEILLSSGAINAKQLQTALEYQSKWKNRIKLGDALVSLGFLSQQALAEAVSKQMGCPWIDLSREPIDRFALNLIPPDLARKNDLIPVRKEEDGKRKVLIVAMADPTDVEAIDEVQFRSGCHVKPCVSTTAEIQKAIKRYYHGDMGDGLTFLGEEGGQDKPHKLTVIRQGRETSWDPEEAMSSGPRMAPAQPRPEALPAPDLNKTLQALVDAVNEQRALLNVLVKKGIISPEDLAKEKNKK